MVFTEQETVQFEGFVEERLGLGILSLRVKVIRQIVVTGGNVGMHFAPYFASQIEGRLQESMGLGKPLLMVQVSCQVIKAKRYRRMFVAEDLAIQAQ